MSASQAAASAAAPVSQPGWPGWPACAAIHPCSAAEEPCRRRRSAKLMRIWALVACPALCGQQIGFDQPLQCLS
jgi:hypothetical protein